MASAFYEIKVAMIGVTIEQAGIISMTPHTS